MKYLVSIVFVVIMAGAACSKGNSSSNTDPSLTDSVVIDSVTVSVNNCVTKNYSGGLTIAYCLDSIMDSRCPTGVLCVWEGQAAAKLRITINQVSHKVQLYVPANDSFHPNDTSIARVNFRLLDVTPYPIFGSINYNNYKAIVRVVRF